MAVDTDDLDTAFATAKGTGGRADSLEKLPDGKYRFRFKQAELKIRGDNVIFVRKLVVIGGDQDGAEVGADMFLKTRDGKNEFAIEQCKKELRLLGFDVDEWDPEKNPGRKFTSELTKAAIAIRGVEFEGTKKSNDGTKKDGTKTTYHNLYVEKRAENDGKPKAFGPEEMAKAVKEDCPFD